MHKKVVQGTPSSGPALARHETQPTPPGRFCTCHIASSTRAGMHRHLVVAYAKSDDSAGEPLCVCLFFSGCARHRIREEMATSLCLPSVVLFLNVALCVCLGIAVLSGSLSLLLCCLRDRAGNNFFKNGDYRNAIAKYTDAIAADPSSHAYWSNRR